MRESDPVVCFVSASGQNVFFGELLDALRRALEGIGVATQTAVDHFPALTGNTVYVFVPHEYVALTMSSAHPSVAQRRRTIALATEQPGTEWFNRVADAAGQCALTIDINRLGVAALRARGVEARYLRLGYVPEWDHWHGSSVERPIDVTFMGGHTTRRGIALARMAPFLSSRRSALHLVESTAPHTEASAAFIAGERKWRALARSKLTVNVHRSELGYFEWQRAVEAIANGCVLVSEHSVGFEPLVPGEHFISASYDSLPQVVETLLIDAEQLERIRRAAYDALRTEWRLADSITVLRDAAIRVLAAAPPAATDRSADPPTPAPKAPELPPIEYVRLAESRDEISVLRMGVKHLLLEHRELKRQLASVVDGDRGPAWTERAYGPRSAMPPRVSVLVTVYNYEHAVGEALRSVGASTFGDYELVVVDDASTDGSVAGAEAALQAMPWVRARLIVRRRNAGLAAARNLAVERALGELVFVLDADNTVYPHALERLVEALDGDQDAAFAYGLLEKVETNDAVTGAVDVIGWLGWDPGRLRYGPYIDAMALIRRQAILAAGGYTTDYRLYGWEDFALWCAFAQAGWRGAHVKEIVARYVAAVHSMISVTKIDATEAYAVLARAYPFMAGAEIRGDGSVPWRDAAAPSPAS
jgi:GT2 family glycosyltransferase